jgi:hypothetical protein
MIEYVFALLMYLHGNLIQYSPKDALSDCLEQKRKVMRDPNEKITVVCKEVKAKTYVDKHGIKRIETILE